VYVFLLDNNKYRTNLRSNFPELTRLSLLRYLPPDRFALCLAELFLTTRRHNRSQGNSSQIALCFASVTQARYRRLTLPKSIFYFPMDQGIIFMTHDPFLRSHLNGKEHSFRLTLGVLLRTGTKPESGCLLDHSIWPKKERDESKMLNIQLRRNGANGSVYREMTRERAHFKVCPLARARLMDGDSYWCRMACRTRRSGYHHRDSLGFPARTAGDREQHAKH